MERELAIWVLGFMSMSAVLALVASAQRRRPSVEVAPPVTIYSVVLALRRSPARRVADALRAASDMLR